MPIKKSMHTIKGIMQDVSPSKATPDYAVDALNIRITARENTTLLTIVNEKGNLEVPLLDPQGNLVNLSGAFMGSAILNSYLVVFIKDTLDKIYRLEKVAATPSTVEYFETILLYSGNLNFLTGHKIETLSVFETSEILKIYWVDDVNQPRVINIAASDAVRLNWGTTSFDFVRAISMNENISITNNLTANGTFPAGVIQYAFTYYNMYAQESNIFYTSSRFYTSPKDRGASSEEVVNNSFEIQLNNLDVNFDYVRIYSILRTSIDATPICRRVTDISIRGTQGSVSYIDTGSNGESIDPTLLLYIGGETIKCGTIALKDNTLFLGDIVLDRQTLSTVRDLIKISDEHVYFTSKSYSLKFIADTPIPSGYYLYNNLLKYNSGDITTFKYGETYRFGLQAQYKTGKWSEPLFIEDVENNIYPRIDENTLEITIVGTKNYTTSKAVYNVTSNIIQALTNLGFVRIRPVIVFPSDKDKTIVCQGVLCPTVYNVGDRVNNSPFVQSSWFTRPNAPFDIYSNDYTLLHTVDSYAQKGYTSRAGIVLTGIKEIVDLDPITIDTSNLGDWVEFRHNFPIPDNRSRHAEIQCISTPSNPYTLSPETFIDNNKPNYYVDQSIVTMHSPEIEFNSDNIDLTNLKLRIVGVVPLTSFLSDIDIKTSTPALNFKGTSTIARGFVKELVAAANTGILGTPTLGLDGEAHFGYRLLVSAPLWYDEVYGNTDADNTELSDTGFVIYPWHRNGSLNNLNIETKSTDGKVTYPKSSLLKIKLLSNIRYSYNTIYLEDNNIWKAEDPLHSVSTGISGVTLFNSNNMTVVKIPAPVNSTLQDLNYYGNVDLVVLNSNGYPIAISPVQVRDTNPIHSAFNASSFVLVTNSAITTGNDPVSIKYKSTPHAVIALNYAIDSSNHLVLRVLPTICDYEVDNITEDVVVNNANYIFSNSNYPFWDLSLRGISLDIIKVGHLGDAYIGTLLYGFLWLGELYRESVDNRFGGNTEEALESNKWIPAGSVVNLYTNGIPNTSVQLNWTEGDTYFLRYDNLKTYPYTWEDQNLVTDIVSFMCETHINIDGRYDKNRGKPSNLVMSPTNFNLLNDVYSLKDNFFPLVYININKYNLSDFHNTLTWTKTKSTGELIDTWTNITLASTLDLDGDKGPIRAIRRFNNSLIAFLDRGISEILFNSRTLLSASDGVPIEIANSGKVDGKRYIGNNVGCTNKWTITETLNGLYFTDKETNSIYLFNGLLNSLTDKHGFRKWLGSHSLDYNNMKSFADKNNSDIYFNVDADIYNAECLCFSEFLNEFTSFMDYKNVDTMFNIGEDFYAWKDSKLWHNFKGDYNMFFNEFKPFSITFIENSEETEPKVFNNIEFRSDSWDNNGNLVNDTFNTLEVWNEYLYGKATLINTPRVPSNLKRKFRVWRANIPRDQSNYRDRIVNTWSYIKLSCDVANTNKTYLHDFNVMYFV